MNKKKRSVADAKQSAVQRVDELMNAANKWMDQLGFDENRKTVAMQQGDLRRMMEKVCDERLSTKERGTAYLAVEQGIEIIAKLPSAAIIEACRVMKDREMKDDRTT